LRLISFHHNLAAREATAAQNRGANQNQYEMGQTASSNQTNMGHGLVNKNGKLQIMCFDPHSSNLGMDWTYRIHQTDVL